MGLEELLAAENSPTEDEKGTSQSHHTSVTLLVPCTLYPVPCTLYPVPCTLYPVPCTLYPLHSTLYHLFSTLSSLPSTLYPPPTLHLTCNPILSPNPNLQPESYLATLFSVRFLTCNPILSPIPNLQPYSQSES